MVESAVDISALPPPPRASRSCSVATGSNYSVVVSNKTGYLCHLHVLCSWPGVKPEVPFAVLTHPDNSNLLRDMKRVGSRKVLKAEPGYKELEVHKSTKLKELWMKRGYSTWLHVTEDSRDPNRLKTAFHLIRSEIYAKFSGEWFLEALRDPATGEVAGCRGELLQDVLPKGVPSFIARLPLVGPALRRMTIRAITRLLEDLNAAIKKVSDGLASGRSIDEVMRELCGTTQDDVAATVPTSDPASATVAVPATATAMATAQMQLSGAGVKSFAVVVGEEGDEGQEDGGDAPGGAAVDGADRQPLCEDRQEGEEPTGKAELRPGVLCLVTMVEAASGDKSGVEHTVTL